MEVEEGRGGGEWNGEGGGGERGEREGLIDTAILTVK